MLMEDREYLDDLAVVREIHCVREAAQKRAPYVRGDAFVAERISRDALKRGIQVGNEASAETRPLTLVPTGRGNCVGLGSGL
jgi:hypothetical protein